MPRVLIALAQFCGDRPWPRGCRGERCPDGVGCVVRLAFALSMVDGWQSVSPDA
ncbi:hypothetical protein I545_6697 [Mycobacterium kansasii 662]|uniref:Uncharacterized protein n=1 Tax=Mycobacterium kansasii 662 TaxID=1299326 RepID=X7Y119_MYCKA|nr:hypothetical protein I545_6697 [Mycobacterium kansasii 662]